MMDPEQLVWEPTDNKNIFFCVNTLKYHFVTEAEELNETSYNSKEECYSALKVYGEEL